MRFTRKFLSICLLLALSAGEAAAQPADVTYQGRLTNTAGVPVADGIYPAVLSLFTTPTGGAPVWTEATSLHCAGGLFTALLGSVGQVGDVYEQHADDALWLEVQVTVGGSAQVMTPRILTSSVPYSLGARRLVDDTISTGGTAILAGVAIPKFISLTTEASRSSLEVHDPNNVTASLGTDWTTSGQGSVMRVGEYVGGTTTLKREAKVEANDSASGIAIDEPGVQRAYLGTETTGGLAPSVTLHFDRYEEGKSVREITDKIEPLSASRYMDSDSDGDGFAESSHWEKVDNTGSVTEMLVDTDDDGVPDAGSQSKAVVSSVVLKSFFQTGDFPTQSQCIDSLDGFGAYKAINTNGHGATVRSIAMGTTEGGSTLSLDNLGSSGQDGVRMHTNDDSGGFQCVSLDGLLPGEPVIGSFSVTTTPRYVRVGIGTATVLARMVLYGDADSVVQSADMGDGSSSSSYKMRARTHDLEAIMKNLGLLTATRVITHCDQDSAVHSVETEELSSGSTSRVTMQAAAGKTNIVIDAHQIQCRSGVYEALGTHQGTMEIAVDGTLKTSLDSDGDGYFSHAVGVDVTSPTHPIEHSSGAHLTVGGVWTNASDENLKENFKSVDGETLLKEIDRLPIRQWNYKVEPDRVTHIGPTAQDFQRVFGVGADDKTISTIDPSGIALAAIQALNKQTRELADQNIKLQEQNAQLQQKLDELGRKMEQLARTR